MRNVYIRQRKMESLTDGIRVLSCFPENREGIAAQNALQTACRDLEMSHQSIKFEKLDFGETSTVDLFYSTDVVVADITEFSRRNGVFYHLAIRESFGNKNNFVTFLNSSESYRGARRGSSVSKVDSQQLEVGSLGLN